MNKQADKIIYYNDGSVPKEEIKATTYQMDDFYKELGSGRVSGLNTFNLLQHFKAAKMSSGKVLDVCCGRSLMLPLLVELHNSKQIIIDEYIGVDIAKENQTAIHTSALGEKIDNPEEFYPFKVTFIESNVACMSDVMGPYINNIDFVIYTSAIEHMQPEDQKNSLKECYKLMKDDSKLFLSGPRSLEENEVITSLKKGKNANQYDVRYSAHLYEPRLSEVYEMLTDANIRVEELFGIYGDIEDFGIALPTLPEPLFKEWDTMSKYLPQEYIRSVFFLTRPEICSEYLIIGVK